MSCEEAPHPYLEAPHPCPVLCHDDTTLEKPFWRAAEHTCVDVSRAPIPRPGSVGDRTRGWGARRKVPGGAYH